MIFYMNLILIILAVSMDGFGVGITYGLRKINISFAALLVIMSCSGIIVITAMLIGYILRAIISTKITDFLGSIILIMLGFFILISVLRSNKTRNKYTIKNRKSRLEFSNFKSVIFKPSHADKNNSGTISVAEALVLGTALALDAFGAGISAALLGYSPILTSILIATMSGFFLVSGIKTGFLLSKNKTFKKFTYFPPILLICIGVYSLI